MKTHAWVLSNTYAVCWDRLVYRTQKVGSPVDLDRDVSIIAIAGPWSRMPFDRAPGSTPAAFWSDLGRGRFMAPAAIALLLRLDRSDLAGKLWQAPDASDPFGNISQHEAGEG